MDGDPLLSATGSKQLNFECTTQPGEILDFPVQKVYCSPLRRALLTALAAYPGHKIIIDPRIREVDAAKGMTKGDLQAWLKFARPDVYDNVNFTNLPRGIWWGRETEEETEERLQSFLREFDQKRKPTQKVAFVGHSVAFQHMVGHPKPFPKRWGTPRGWPKNFKPYHACVQPVGHQLRVVAKAAQSGNVILVRHAHSARQAARTAAKKAFKAELKLKLGRAALRMKLKKKQAKKAALKTKLGKAMKLRKKNTKK